MFHGRQPSGKQKRPHAFSRTLPITAYPKALRYIDSLSCNQGVPMLARARLEAVVEALGVVIFTASPDGEIVWWPASAEQCYGFSARDIVGTSLFSLDATTADRDREPGLLAETVSGGHVPGHRLMQSRADGSMFACFRALALVVSADGQGVEVAVLCQPLDGLVEADPSTYLWHPYGQHAASIAHDVNNVIGAIMNYAEFVSEDLAHAATNASVPDWGRLDRDVQNIRQAAERASALSRQLIDDDRQLGRGSRASDLNDLVKGAAALLTGVAGERVVVDISALDPDLWPISVDVSQAERVLVNLVANAAQAMPSGGTLRVETKNVTLTEPETPEPGLVGLAGPGRYACLNIEDSGIGMTDEVKSHAFEPKFTTKPRGTGLGLATVARIVQEYGGHVRLESEVGRGTTVSVILPANL
jgi:PAS domain S-box-containing protein